MLEGERKQIESIRSYPRVVMEFFIPEESKYGKAILINLWQRLLLLPDCYIDFVTGTRSKPLQHSR